MSPYWYLFTAFVGLNLLAVRLYQVVPGNVDLRQARTEERDERMKLLMIIIDTKCREELEVLFKHHGVTGY